jgi:hypothetical protein
MQDGRMHGVLQFRRLPNWLLQQYDLHVRKHQFLLRFGRRRVRGVRDGKNLCEWRLRLQREFLSERLLRWQRKLPSWQHKCPMRYGRRGLSSLQLGE